MAVGFDAGGNLTTGDNNIYLGSLVRHGSNTIRIGTSGTQNRAFIRGIRGVTTGNHDAVPVLIDTAGQLGTTSSSRRYKKDIKPMEQASKAISGAQTGHLSLQERHQRYTTIWFDRRGGGGGESRFGGARRERRDLHRALRAVNAMLLNEFLKEHRKVEEQQATITELKSTVAKQENALEATIARLAARLEDQDSKIQRVSAELEISKRRHTWSPLIRKSKRLTHNPNATDKGDAKETCELEISVSFRKSLGVSRLFVCLVDHNKWNQTATKNHNLKRRKCHP